MTTDEFIKRARLVHKGTYNYNLTDYKGAHKSKDSVLRTRSLYAIT